MALLSADDARVLCPRVRTAGSFSARLVGLMGRARLDPDEGLYLPTGSIHMLFVRFPIDCLFLGRRASDGTQRVISMRPGLRPWTGVAWQLAASGVVELPAGWLAGSGLQVGDVVRLEEAAPDRQ